MGAALIFVSFHTGPILPDALAAARDCMDVEEIIVVDNGNPTSDESLIDFFARIDPRFVVKRGQGNVGFAAGCNLGARDAGASTLIFVNPDAVLRPHAAHALATELTNAFAKASRPALVGGDLRTEGGAPDRGSRRNRITLWNAFISALGIDTINLHRTPMPTAPVTVGAVSGALMAMRRADFEALGGFDEGYFLHMEDVDLCRRVEEAGGTVLFVPGPHGTHYRSSSDATPREIAHHKAEGFARYFSKFARTPLERAAVELAAIALHLLLPLRAKP
jgi:hypothetical protein